jgi:hypothetical protein
MVALGVAGVEQEGGPAIVIRADPAGTQEALDAEEAPPSLGGQVVPQAPPAVST